MDKGHNPFLARHLRVITDSLDRVRGFLAIQLAEKPEGIQWLLKRELAILTFWRVWCDNRV